MASDNSQSISCTISTKKPSWFYQPHGQVGRCDKCRSCETAQMLPLGMKIVLQSILGLPPPQDFPIMLWLPLPFFLTTNSKVTSNGLTLLSHYFSLYISELWKDSKHESQCYTWNKSTYTLHNVIKLWTIDNMELSNSQFMPTSG